MPHTGRITGAMTQYMIPRNATIMVCAGTRCRGVFSGSLQFRIIFSVGISPARSRCTRVFTARPRW